MKNKPLLLLSLIVILVVVGGGGGVFFLTRSRGKTPLASSSPALDLPLNAIPVAERPFVTLTPDLSGRNLFLGIDQITSSEVMEYELVYNATGKQEGVFGRVNLATATFPVEKKLLLGSKSAGGKVTYHEGVTGGSLTLTYGETRLKEQFNFLRFDPKDSEVTSPDARFSVRFVPTAFSKNTVVVVMKPFGLPAGITRKLVAGPYAYLAPKNARGKVEVNLRLPAGEHLNPTISEYVSSTGRFSPLETTLKGDTVSAETETGTLFVVTAE